MSRRRHHRAIGTVNDPIVVQKARKAVSHAFVLEALTTLSPATRPMFGCLAVYIADTIVFVLRDKPGAPADDGVWLATTEEHHQSLCREFSAHAINRGVREEGDGLAGAPG
jgi:hypothetical protein